MREERLRETFREEAREILAELEVSLLGLEENPDDRDAVGRVFRALHTIKGAGGLAGFDEMADFAHEVETVYEAVRDGQNEVSSALISLSLAASDLLQRLLHEELTLDDPQATALIAELRFYQTGSGGSRLGELENASSADDLLVQHGLFSDGTPESAPSEQQRVKDLRRQRETQETAASIRVRSDKLDKLVDLIGELVTVQARLTQTSQESGDSTLLSIAEEVERLTWDLRDQVLGIRMLPIGTTFGRLRRLVRDLCENLGKEVDLTFEGTDTELDKTVLERLGDPLIHLVRNALDHGIESPDVRSKAGKNLRGSIHIGARQVGSQVEITIADDGIGLDPDKIRRRALDLSLITPDAQLTQKEIFGLIFHSGLSTAGEITNISGRGVGMDVVRQAVLALRATIDVDSLPGLGSTVTIRLPLTLAIIDGLLVRIACDHFVLPLSCVEECIELRSVDVTNQNRNLVRIRGEIVPYIRLREQFAVAGQPQSLEHVVITRNETNRVGFVVDELIGSHQTVIKPLGQYCSAVTGLAGATILGDGTVALILDVPRLIQEAERREKYLFDL